MSKDHTILCNCSLPLLYIVLNQLNYSHADINLRNFIQTKTHHTIISTYYLMTASVNILNLKCNHNKKPNRKNTTEREMFQN